MHTTRNRRAVASPVVVRPFVPPTVKDAPFILRDQPPSGRIDAAAPPAFPADIVIALSPALRGAVVAPVAPLKRKVKAAPVKVKVKVKPTRKKRARATSPAKPSAPKRKRTTQREKVPPQDAAGGVQPIRPVSPVQVPPSPTRPRSKRTAGRAVAKGTRIASLDLRPQLPLDLPVMPHSTAFAEPAPVVAAASAPPASIAPLPRSAAVTPWRRNGFVDTLAYWLRGTQRRLLALVAPPKPARRAAVNEDAAARERRERLKAAMAPASPRLGAASSMEVAALRAENERLRAQLAQLTAQADLVS